MWDFAPGSSVASFKADVFLLLQKGRQVGGKIKR